MRDRAGTAARRRARGVLALTAAFGATMLAPPALADPCKAPLPKRAGEVFSAPVRYVGDGDGLCVGPTSDPNTWVEVRLADFDAPELDAPGGREAKARLEGLVRGRTLRCTAERGRQGRVIVHDRVIAACTLDGRPLGRLIRARGGVTGGR